MMNIKTLNVKILKKNRDSFFSAIVRYFNNTFNSIRYYWRYNITYEDLEYIKNNSDIIILEMVERNLPSLLKYEFPKE